VGCGAPVRDPSSPAREHDSRHVPIDASWQGCGVLADQANARLARLYGGHESGVRLVIFLQAILHTVFFETLERRMLE